MDQNMYNIKLVRVLKAKDEKVEFLFEASREFIERYKEETGDKEFNQDSFDAWFEKLLLDSLDSEY